MSEEAKPPQAEGGAPAGAAPAKPKDAPIWMLAMVIVLALGAGGALGGLLLAPRLIHAKQAAAAGAQDPKAKSKKKKDEGGKKGGEHGGGKSASYKLENIVVNPADSQGQRFLMCSLALESDDPKALDALREREVELRDRVVTTLTSMTLDELTAVGARDTLRQRLVESIRPMLGEEGEDVELKVYLPSFVIQ